MTIDIHALSGAYALDAVDDVERARFERHLAECTACRAEVASLREAGAQLGEISDTPAPPAMRARVLADIATVRPLPPVIARLDQARHARSRRRIPALIAAAAALVVIGGVGATAWHPWSSDQTSVSQASEVNQVLQASDRRSVTHHVKDGTATITMSKGLNLAVLQTQSLPAPPSGKVYELWLIHGDQFVPAGLMTQGGDVTTLLSGNPRTATAAGITLEPTGGSDQPSPGGTVATYTFESA